jgi:MFS transporter, DHA2 family, multidrug resistance protein
MCDLGHIRLPTPLCLTQHHQWNLVGHLSPLNPRYTQALEGAAAALRAHGSHAVPALHQAQALIYDQLQRQAAMLAFIDVFWILGIACLGMISLMFIIWTERHNARLPPVH